MLLNLLIYLTFILFSLGQLGRISFFGQQVNIYAYEGALLFVLLVLFVKYGAMPIKSAYSSFKSIFIFLAFLFFSYILNFFNFSWFENAVSFLYFLRLIFYCCFFFYLLFHCKKRKESRTVLKSGLTIFIGLTILISIAQYFFYPDLRNLIYGGWDPHFYRLFGVFFDTSIAGSVYGLLFLLVFFSGKELYSHRTRYIILSTLFIFIVLTFNRSLYIVFLLSIFIYVWLKKDFKKLAILILLFAALIIIAPKPSGEGVNLLRVFSIESRIKDHQTAIQMWKRNPLIGIGYNRIRYEKRHLNIIEQTDEDSNHSGASFHSSFLIILVTGGIVGLVGFVGVLYQLVKLHRVASYLIIFTSLLSLTDNILLLPFILFLLFSAITLIYTTPSRKLR